MLNGLPQERIRELRALFPGKLIAEMIGRIAAFEKSCFAGTAYLADEIGRSQRTVFRYFREMREAGILKRVWGSRELEHMPEGAQYPGKLRQFGYKLTGFTGWLGPFVAQGQHERRHRMTEHERHEQARERKRQAARERRAEQERRRKNRERARLADEFPELAKRATEQPPRADRTPPPRGPRYVSSVVPLDPDLAPPEPRDTGPPD